MKKPIGYKIGGVTHFPQEPSFGSVVGPLRVAVCDGIRSAPLLKDGLMHLKSAEDRATRPTTNHSKRSPRMNDIPKTLVEVTEYEKIELIRNMIRDELAKEKKAAKCDSHNYLVEQVQHLNMDITLVQSRLCELEEKQSNNLDELTRQCALRLQEARDTKDSVKSRQKGDETLNYALHKLEAKLKEVEIATEGQLEAMQSRLNKNIHEISTRLDRDLKGHVVKIMNSQSDHHGESPKRATSRLVSLEHSVNVILQKLEGYNSVLEDLKEINPSHTLKLTDLVARMAEYNKDRKKEVQYLRKQYQQLDRSHLTSCEKLEATESELYKKLEQLERTLSQTDLYAAVRELKQQLQQECNSVELLNRTVHEAKEDIYMVAGRVGRLYSTLVEEFRNNQSPSKYYIAKDLVDNLQHLLTVKLNDLTAEYNSNFKFLDEAMVETRENVFELVAVNRALTQKLNTLYLDQNGVKLEVSHAQKLTQEITRAAESNNLQLGELLQRGMSCEHELRLLKDRFDQIETPLGSSRRRISIDSLDSKPGQTKEYRQLNGGMNLGNHNTGNYGSSLLDEKIYDQLGTYE